MRTLAASLALLGALAFWAGWTSVRRLVECGPANWKGEGR